MMDMKGGMKGREERQLHVIGISASGSLRSGADRHWCGD
jgi:hypothetical protein